MLLLKLTEIPSTDQNVPPKQHQKQKVSSNNNNYTRETQLWWKAIKGVNLLSKDSIKTWPDCLAWLVLYFISRTGNFHWQLECSTNFGSSVGKLTLKYLEMMEHSRMTAELMKQLVDNQFGWTNKSMIIFYLTLSQVKCFWKLYLKHILSTETNPFPAKNNIRSISL